MDFILYSLALLVVLALLFFAIERPYVFAFILIFLYFYRRTNIELPGPLDARGLMTLILFARLFLFDKKNYLLARRFLFQNLNWVLLSIFIVTSFYISYTSFGELTRQLKYHSLLIISLILGFTILINGHGRKVFYNAIVLTALLSLVDLMYTFIVYGNFNIRSLLGSTLLHDHSMVNHSDVALLCGYALIMTFIFFIKKQMHRTISIALMLVFSLGIIFSTSRSILVAIIPVFIIIFLVQREIQFNLNKVLVSFLGVVLFLVSFYFIYNAILTSGEFKSSYIDEAYYRLYEEPMTYLGGNKTKVFKKSGEAEKGNIEGRYKRSTKDLVKYSKLNLKTQLFGLGIGGYENKNFGEDYKLGYALNAHNGYVLLLVERGIFGFLLYIFIIINLSFRSFKLLRQNLITMPIIYVFLTLVIYAVGQNSELTQNLAFILLGAAIASTKESLAFENKGETNPDTPLLIAKQS